MQYEHTQADGSPNSLESAYSSISINSRTSQEQILGCPPHQWTDFTANIPKFLSPYPCGEGFSARDSDRYSAFCGFNISRDRLCSFELITQSWRELYRELLLDSGLRSIIRTFLLRSQHLWNHLFFDMLSMRLRLARWLQFPLIQS
jgi:hypothetical protein